MTDIKKLIEEKNIIDQKIKELDHEIERFQPRFFHDRKLDLLDRQLTAMTEYSLVLAARIGAEIA